MRRAVVSAIVLAACLNAGCHHHHSNAAQTGGSAAISHAPPAAHDSCSLLEPKEVEAVLGAPLAVPPYHIQGGTPQPGGEDCAYDDAGFHRILVEVNWSGGAMAWKMYGSVQSLVNQNPDAKRTVHLADGSDIAGEWDEARLVGCCEFMALRGDQTVSVDFGGTAAVTVKQAAQLADAALKRLDKPLAIDGRAGVQAAKDYAAHRPQRVDPCTLLTRAEAEAIMGPLSGDPKSDKNTCTYPRTGPGNANLEAELKVDWQGGFHRVREVNGVINGFAKGFLGGQGLDPNAKQAVEKTVAGPAPEANPAWEISGPSVSRGYCAAKRDVLVEVDSLGLTHEQTLAVLAKAMSKI